eukprot:TRINITY_DN15351_c0_g1_i1.p1 TRINITY_DN15351_c0_g1~~TRINITY_DN15351_c0_g1_i1.p1  ORF type:complete len:324 (+),score=52.12 TRINITY_DN15351_c0_g1_i1:137-973(+)
MPKRSSSRAAAAVVPASGGVKKNRNSASAATITSRKAPKRAVTKSNEKKKVGKAKLKVAKEDKPCLVTTVRDGKTVKRCSWAGDKPLYHNYHDHEWGVPLYDDQRLFEFLTLECFQAGLSWYCILSKREHFKRCFKEFDVKKVSRFTQKDIDRLLNDPTIIRHRGKIVAAIENAKCFLEVQAAYGSFSNYMWSFMPLRKPLKNGHTSFKGLPSKTPLSEKLSKDLRARGFKFIGPTVVYSHMQATGMINDHMTGCFRYKEVQGLHQSVPVVVPREAPL